jgi:Tol biopolymer transport system component
MRAIRIQLLGAVGVGVTFLLTAASGAAYPPAKSSRVGGDSAQAHFKIAYTHSSGPAWVRGDVFVMNDDGSEQRNLSRAPGLDGGHVWSPDGRKLAFLSRRDGKQEIYVVNADGSELRNLTRSPEHDFAPAWSPDGRKIAFTRSRDYYKRGNVDLYVVNADGSGQRRVTHTMGRHDGNPVWSYPGTAAWSPNGRMLTYATKRDGNFDVYVVNADGSGERNLTRSPERDFFLAWLPDGRIAFFSDREGTDRRLYVMNTDGSGRRNLTREWGLDIRPVWSPSGAEVAFVLGGSLHVMDADGSRRRKLADDAWRDGAPAWSPDGRKLAFMKSLGGWERGSREIFVVEIDGSGLRRLTRRPGHDGDPVWSPAPR